MTDQTRELLRRLTEKDAQRLHEYFQACVRHAEWEANKH